MMKSFVLNRLRIIQFEINSVRLVGPSYVCIATEVRLFSLFVGSFVFVLISYLSDRYLLLVG